MMGFGFLVMLAILAIPLLLTVGLVVLMLRPISGPTAPSAALSQRSAVVSDSSPCSHCGAALRPEWAHCPQCGAPSEAAS